MMLHIRSVIDRIGIGLLNNNENTDSTYEEKMSPENGANPWIDIKKCVTDSYIVSINTTTTIFYE